MKIRVYSDLHLDWYAKEFHSTRVYDPGEDEKEFFWMPPMLPDDKDTILILAGDLWTGTKFIEYAGYSWIGKVAPRFKQVLIVLGNHDYWPGNNAISIKHGAEKCNAMLQDHGHLNVHVLDKDVYTEGEYLFIGATLWTDMKKGDPLIMHTMPHYMNYDGKIAYDINGNGAWERFTSQNWVSEHYKHRDYIKLITEQNKDKKIIVITHHLPLENLNDPKFDGDYGNYYYHSDLSNLILDNGHIIMWIYGHTHYQRDEVFPPYAGEGGCRLLNNCVGYQSEHMEQWGLVKHGVIEL